MSNKDKKTVVQTILSYDVFDDEKIEELLNDYIYGDRITFTLWKMGNVALSAEQIDVIWGLEGAFVQDLNLYNTRECNVVKGLTHITMLSSHPANSTTISTTKG